MTNVIPLASPRAGFQVQPSAPSPATLTQVLDAIAPHQHMSCTMASLKQVCTESPKWRD